MRSVVEQQVVVYKAAEKAERDTHYRSFWPAVAVLGFIGSGLCMTAGLGLSALTLIGAIQATAVVAYVTVATLLAAFALAFLGAHAMDRRG